MNEEEKTKLCDAFIKIAVSTGSHPYSIAREYINVFVDNINERKNMYEDLKLIMKNNYDDNNYPWRWY